MVEEFNGQPHIQTATPPTHREGWGGDVTPRTPTPPLRPMLEDTTSVTYSKAMTAFKDKYIPVNEGKSFTIEDVLRFFGCMSDNKEARQAYYRVLYELSVNKKPTLERKNKNYRIIDKEMKIINWHQTTEHGLVEIEWPYSPQDNRGFGFDDDIVLYEGDMVLIAGEGNRGKTAFVLNILVNNMERIPSYYFSSEFNAVKFRDRMREFKWKTLFNEDGQPKFTVVERNDNWQDVIQPDGLNIIDWIKLDDEMWKIRSIMDGIKGKLHKGIAIICIQKRTYKKYGEGGEYSKDLSSVYLTLSYDDKAKQNILYVEKVKTPGQLDPNFNKYAFNIFHGAELSNIKKLPRASE